MSHRLLHYVDSTAYGGLEETVLTSLTHLDRARFDPVLVHHDEPGLEPLLSGARALGVPLWCVPRMEGRGGIVPMAAFANDLRRARPHVFHAHLRYQLACHHGLVAAATAGIPAICVSEHAFVDLPWRWSFALERRLASRVDRYLPVSHGVRDRLLATFGLRPDRVEVVHNGVSPARFERRPDPALRAALSGGRAYPLVLTVARLDRQKGHRYLLEAARLLPEALFVLAGDGPERPALERRACRLGIGDRVVFLGHRRDVPDLLAVCDVFVLPSSAFEALGLSTLEAMAACTPVVVTTESAATEVVVDGRSGLVVPARDPGAIADAVRRLLDDRAFAERMATTARRRVGRYFTATRMVERTTAVYDHLLQRSETRRADGH